MEDYKYLYDYIFQTYNFKDAVLMNVLIPTVFNKALKVSDNCKSLHAEGVINEELIKYIKGFYDYLLKNNTIEELKPDLERSSFVDTISSFIVEHYMNNEELRYNLIEDNIRYNPIATSLNGSLNLLLRSLSRFNKENQSELAAILDIVQKGLVLAKCVLDLIAGGFEIEAFAIWRTLYELTAILKVLIENRKTVLPAYLRHMDYSLAFRELYFSKEQINEIFIEIKNRMAALDLKSKDMKRFIEYGWISSLPDFKSAEPEYRFNFREGIERAAGLEGEHLWFELASELAHSSPLLIYSNKSYFRDVSMHNLYSSSLRLISLYRSLYDQTQTSEESTRFSSLLSHYISELKFFYERISKDLAKEQSPIKPKKSQSY